ncbi:MAG TPA: PIG-L deacetylase family protein [Methanobacteriaceae archaeon]|nr:PIG-L deacetylase family protein [Methanobacteriaceae archaeon]
MTILVIAAHPDDEVLGCGGTLARLSPEHECYILILGEGAASRDMNPDKLKKYKKDLKNQGTMANKSLGAKKTFFEDLPDNRFDEIPLLDIVKIIEDYLDKIDPSTIFTHHGGDLNIDHHLTNRALFTAARPFMDSSIERIMLFEVLSSTEWCEPTASNYFIPNTYYNISETIEKKLDAFRFYENEVRDYPHPRSVTGIKLLAQKRGMEMGLEYAEAFKLGRFIVP